MAVAAARFAMTRPTRDAFLAAGLFLGTLALYAGLRGAGFVHFDDPDYVTANPVVQQGLTPGGFVWALSTDHAGNWFPLTWISHMLDVSLFGLDPRGHHATSVVLHALSAVLLFDLLRRGSGSVWRSALAAALFAWHPLRVESVAWIAERKDVLSVMLALLSMRAWVLHTLRGDRRAYVASLGWFALGLLAKPMLVTLPFLLVVLEVWPLRRISLSPARDGLREVTRSLARKAPFLALALLSSVVTLVVQRAAATSLEILPFSARAANAVVSVVVYLRQLVWPVDLAAIYPHPGAVPTSLWIAALALLAALTAIAAARARRDPSLLAGWCWFLGALVPVIGLVQVGAQAHADRYTYLPSIGLCWAAAWALPAASALARRTSAALAVAVCVALAATTLRQVPVWQDGVRLFAHATAVIPGNAPALLHLGNALAAADRLPEAADAYRELLSIDSASPEANHHLGVVLARQRRDAEAARHFEAAIRLDPAWADPHHDLGVLAARRRDFVTARAHLARAVELRPDAAAIRLRYGLVLQSLGETAAARAEIEAAVRLDPHASEARHALRALSPEGS
ncbi:MAG: tetratricopeptide repeat protein [Myxococcota bacterium]|nr:tetratricopeptide repeat protein [Myxococcota bacterium]